MVPLINGIMEKNSWLFELFSYLSGNWLWMSPHKRVGRGCVGILSWSHKSMWGAVLACRVKTRTEVCVILAYQLLTVFTYMYKFVTECSCCYAASDPYLIMSCEGQKVYSPVHKSTLSPEFDVKAVFYRKKTKEHICIQVRLEERAHGRLQWCCSNMDKVLLKLTPFRAGSNRINRLSHILCSDVSNSSIKCKLDHTVTVGRSNLMHFCYRDDGWKY